MFQSIASYIWGVEEEEVPLSASADCIHDEQIEVDNEWIFIPTKDKATNKMTLSDRTVDLEECPLADNTSQCLDEDSMESSNEQENVDERILEVAKQDAKPVGAKRQILMKRVPLKDLNAKVALVRKNDSPKNLKRNNKVYTRVHNTRKNKQFGRMEGKHVGMVAQRSGK